MGMKYNHKRFCSPLLISNLNSDGRDRASQVVDMGFKNLSKITKKTLPFFGWIRCQGCLWRGHFNWDPLRLVALLQFLQVFPYCHRRIISDHQDGKPLRLLVPSLKQWACH